MTRPLDGGSSRLHRPPHLAAAGRHPPSKACRWACRCWSLLMHRCWQMHRSCDTSCRRCYGWQRQDCGTPCCYCCRCCLCRMQHCDWGCRRKHRQQLAPAGMPRQRPSPLLCCLARELGPCCVV